jgi:hypothetical protein
MKLNSFCINFERAHKSFSALDIVVVMNEPFALSTMAELSDALSELDLPWKVDIVDWASIS